jgi:hypothetical protein
MESRDLLVFVYNNAYELHLKYNTEQTYYNLESIKSLIDKTKQLKKENTTLKLNYNELFFDFTNYRAIRGDDENINPDYTHDAIDIYDDINDID